MVLVSQPARKMNRESEDGWVDANLLSFPRWEMLSEHPGGSTNKEYLVSNGHVWLPKCRQSRYNFVLVGLAWTRRNLVPLTSASS